MALFFPIFLGQFPSSCVSLKPPLLDVLGSLVAEAAPSLCGGIVLTLTGRVCATPQMADSAGAGRYSMQGLLVLHADLDQPVE